MSNKYESLDRHLRSAGFFTNGVESKGDWDRTTVCAQKLSGNAVFSGHSFWVTLLPDGWIVGTWGGLLYRLPDANSINQLCTEWLTRYPDKVVTAFDEDVKKKYGLVEISEEQFDELAGQTMEDD
jgi:hypothetical protein